jgi:hypothetical protein
MQLQPEFAGRRLQVSRQGLDIGIVRVDEEPDNVDRGRELMQQLQSFWSDLHVQAGNAGDIAAWPAKACHQAQLHRIEAGDQDDRDRRRRSPSGQHRSEIRHDHVDPTMDQIGPQRRQTIVLTFGPAILDCDILSFDEAGVFQALAESARSHRIPIGGCAVEKADHRNRSLLRARP